MAEVDLVGDQLSIRFSRSEKIWGLVSDLSVPRSSVQAVSLIESWREVRGWRVGLGLPGVRLIGVWRKHGHKQLVSLRRDAASVKFVLSGEKYDEVLLSTPDAKRLIGLLGS